ncbi:MAG: hypothetical protein DIZ78_11035 [endosymbiont of Escarpia spicata]|uniref:Uncharacterized protein n=1 Tax=endosymbiont of Escarpia spicata TaxID=2200908 RepID=A0A370DKP7_9GAMM|nr:MAG: hypothetical protein DIZ78_11035 [endosymbiont of Escarpia spicata]
MNDKIELTSLNEPVPDFDYFADNQVLTAGQLNRAVDFLDGQHRLTRARLLGQGIVCGLTFQATANRVALEAGVGVTSEGDLLQIPETQRFTHYRIFTDDSAKYPPFHGRRIVRKKAVVSGSRLLVQPRLEVQPLRPGIQPIEPILDIQPLRPGNQLIELLQDGSETDAQPLSLTKAQLAQLVLVLYQETYIKENDLCNASDCDNRGPTRTANLKLLLAPKDLLPKLPLTPKDEYLAMNEVDAPRLDLDIGTINQYDGNNGLAKRYITAIDKMKLDLGKAFDDAPTSGLFTSTMQQLYSSGKWSLRLNQARFQVTTNSQGIQYVFSFFKDLIEAYHECREALFELDDNCMGDPASFSKHLVLGLAHKRGEVDDAYRYRFQATPILRAEDEKKGRFVFLLRRIDAMLRHFKKPSGEIRLSPSQKAIAPLGERAIPGYGMSDYSNHTHDSFYRQSIDDYDFIRIEGHQGKKVKDVQTELETMARRHNLAFKVEAIQLEDADPIFIRPFHFPDIDILFNLQKADIRHTLKQAGQFGTDLQQTVLQDSRVDELEPTTPKTLFSAPRQRAGQLQLKVAEAIPFMPKKLVDAEFNKAKVTAFHDKVNICAVQAKAVSTDIKKVARPILPTPAGSLLDGSKFLNLEKLLDLWERRKKKVRKESIFDRFLKHHPGLEHQGGVPRGGTFVLVYDASGSRVLADFCLPYFSYFDPSILEPEEETAPEIDLPVFKPPVWWIDKIDMPIFTIQGIQLKDTLNLVDTRITTAKEDLQMEISYQTQIIESQFTGFNVGSGFYAAAQTPDYGSWGQTPGIAGQYGFDREQTLVMAEILRAQREKGAIEERMDKGLAVSGDEEKFMDTEQRLAELIVKASKTSRVNDTNATPTAADKQFMSSVRDAALDLSGSEARQMVGEEFSTIQEGTGTSEMNTMMKGKLGQISGAF